jgi:hypothetical protein
LSEREKRNQPLGTEGAKLAVDFTKGSPELQLNGLYDGPYEYWLLEYIRTHGFISAKEAVNAGAQVVGCNPITSKRYLDKLTSIAGPLMLTRDMLRHTVVVLRDPEAPPTGPTNGHAPGEPIPAHTPNRQEATP